MLTTKLIVTIGGVIIFLSGIASIVLGLKTKEPFYDVYPGGKMGHIGIHAGVTAVIIGLVIIFGIVQLYDSMNTNSLIVGAILTIILGHIGAVAGAMYVGTLSRSLLYCRDMAIDCDKHKLTDFSGIGFNS